MPDLANLRAYGCKAYAMTSDAQLCRDRLMRMRARAWKGYLVGYASSNSYRIWNPQKGEVITTRAVLFAEYVMFDGYLAASHDDFKDMSLEEVRDHYLALLRKLTPRSPKTRDSNPKPTMTTNYLHRSLKAMQSLATILTPTSLRGRNLAIRRPNLPSYRLPQTPHLHSSSKPSTTST